MASLRGAAMQRSARARTGSAVQTFASATADSARHPALTAAGLHGFPATASPLPPGTATAALRAVYQDQFLQFAAGNAAAVAAAEQAAAQRQAVQQAAVPQAAPYGSLPPSYAATAAYTAAAARYYSAAAAAASHQVGPAAAAAAATAAAGLTVPAYPFPVAHAVPSAGVPRDYIAEPYLGHALAPVTGYGATVYRNAYNRFAPY